VVAIASSLYVFGTVAFAVAATVIGIRLLLLSRRTGQAAERNLGLGLGLTGGLGYGPMVLSFVAQNAIRMQGGEPPAFLALLVWAGWILHNIGFTFMLFFIRGVFRPEAGWAKAMVAIASVWLWVGWAIYAYQGGLRDGLPTSGYWIAFAMIGGYPIWGIVESFRYWRLMKRRLELGLADPIVTNRFLLWFLATLCGMGSIWVVNIPSLAGGTSNVSEVTALTVTCLMGTAILGLTTISFYWLTFFPPSWYRKMLVGSDGAAQTS